MKQKSKRGRYLADLKKPFSPLSRGEKFAWAMLTLVVFLQSIHLSLSNYPSLLLTKLKNPAAPNGIELFRDLGSYGRILIYFSTLLTLIAFISFFIFYYQTFRGKILLYTYYKIVLISLLMLTLYTFLYHEVNLNFLVLLYIFYFLALAMGARKLVSFKYIYKSKFERGGVIFLFSLLLPLVVIIYGESYTINHFDNVVKNIKVNEDKTSKEVVKHGLQGFYSYNYLYTDPESKDKGNEIVGKFDYTNCNEEGSRDDLVTNSKGSELKKSYWVRADNIFYSNFTGNGFVRDDSRIYHIGPTIIGLLLSGAIAESNDWGVCKDLQNLPKLVIGNMGTEDKRGVQFLTLKFDKVKVAKLSKIRTWSWLDKLPYKGIAKIYAFESNLPDYSNFLNNIDHITLTLKNGSLAKLDTFTKNSKGESISIEELNLVKIENFKVNKPVKYINLSNKFKDSLK